MNEFITSLYPTANSIFFSVASIAILMVLFYLLDNNRSLKADIKKINNELEETLKMISQCKKDSNLLLEDLKREEAKALKLREDLILEYDKSSSLELSSQHQRAVIEVLKEKLTKYENKPKPKPRVKKYNKPNTLYIAYDFNISGNQSYAKVRQHIKNAKTSNDDYPAVKTTSIMFFNYMNTLVFEDILLVKKNGASISIKKLHSNPEYYIGKNTSLFSIISNNKKALDDLNFVLNSISKNEIKFVKEEEL